MTATELVKRLDIVIPPALSCPWDNDGLQCGASATEEVSGVTVALDICDAVIDFAVAHRCNLIVTHHPLIFQPIPRLSGEDAVGKYLLKLCRHGISAASFHTRLDSVSGGVNDILAETLGLKNVTAMPLDDGTPMGRVGELKTPMTARELALSVKEKLSAPAVSYTEGDGRIIRRIAVLGGSGGDEISAAKAAGADAFVVGEAKHHEISQAADGDLCVIFAGHYYTEYPVCRKLAELVKREAPGLPVFVAPSYDGVKSV